MTDSPKNLLKPYIPDKCPHCGQTETYLISIDRGSVELLWALARAVGAKGINVVHPRKELEGNALTSNQVGNLSRPRFHGLIAKIKGNAGNYCLTSKGARFLRGEAIPKFAIISKSEKKQIGYHEPMTYICTVSDFKKDMPYWEGINYEIVKGRVVKDLETKLPL